MNRYYTLNNSASASQYRMSKKTPQRKAKSAPKVIRHAPRSGISTYKKRGIFWAESYTSLLMGVVVVIVGILFTISLIRQSQHVQDTTSTSTGPTTPSQAIQLPGKYVVKSGDDLWHIAEQIYGSGYNWVDIANANNLANPSAIFAGNILILPKADKRLPDVAVTPTLTPLGQVMHNEAIKERTYTVVSGDSLWDIAVRAYADGYRWVDIAKANNLANPNLIFSGNVLNIPR